MDCGSITRRLRAVTVQAHQASGSDSTITSPMCAGSQACIAAKAIVLSLPLAWWACTVTARNLRVMDPQSIVFDEIVC
ncbi:MAG: hypothetical protein EOO25_20600, partial [Comamonadaceae bacterium]